MNNEIEYKTFESLFLEDSKGRIRNWSIKVKRFKDYSEICILHGYIRQLETSIKIYKGKHAGRKTEMNHYEYAISQAQSRWRKKVEDGYIVCKNLNFITPKGKKTEEKEFIIVNYTFEHDSYTNDKLVIWTCQTDEKKTFNIRPMGTVEEKKWLYENAKMFIGKKILIKYRNLNEFNIPRYPTTLKSHVNYIRD